MKYKKCFSLKYKPFSSVRNNYYSNSNWSFSEWRDPRKYEFWTIEEYNDIINNLKNFVSKENNIKIKGNIYAGKGCEVPRYKLKEYINENDLKKTNNINKADIVILNRKSVNDVLEWLGSNRRKPISSSKLAVIDYNQKLIDTIISIDQSSDSNDRYSFKSLIERANKNGKISHTVIYEENYNNFPTSIKNIIGDIDFQNLYEVDTYRTNNQEQVFNVVKECIKLNKNVVWDNYVLEQINNDGIDLDEDYLNTLKGMFESKDKDNVLLALEMLSNVNINKHGLQIAMLLNQYRGYFSWGNGINSQAYKTLNNYFTNKKILWKEDFRIFLAGLYNNYSDDPQSKLYIENFLKDSINDVLRKNKYHTNYFEVESFDIKLQKR